MSQSKAQEKTIEGVKYEMYPLPPEMSMDLLTDLINVVAPVVTPVLTSIFSGQKSGEDVMDKEIDPNMFASALGSLNTETMKSTRKALVSAFSQVTLRDNVSLDNRVESVYLGNIGEMLQWLAWGCQVQWGKSLSGLMKDQISKAASLIPQASQSPGT